jgi:hypothetical protein
MVEKERDPTLLLIFSCQYLHRRLALSLAGPISPMVMVEHRLSKNSIFGPFFLVEKWTPLRLATRPAALPALGEKF